MPDTIRVEAGSIRTYGTRAQLRFDNIRKNLVSLVEDVATVQYFGPNASQFKKQCADMAEDYSRVMLKDLAAIAEAVKVSTSNITSSLGGPAINIEVNGSPIPVPSINQGDGAVVADLTALDALIPTVKGRFAQITAELTEHLRELRATDWTGQAKTNAVDAVGSFTSKSIEDTAQAETSVTKFIQDQVSATRAADV
jgi:hypothetical protein